MKPTVALYNAAAARLQTTSFHNIDLETNLFDVSYGGALQLANVGLSDVDVGGNQLVGTANDDGCDSFSVLFDQFLCSLDGLCFV
jgi:hypothetical protein